MIEYVEFENFRNLNGRYCLNDKLSIIVGKKVQERPTCLMAYGWLFHYYQRITSE